MAKIADLVKGGATMFRRPHWHPDEHLCAVVVPPIGFSLLNHTWSRDLSGDADPDLWDDWEVDPNDRPHSVRSGQPIPDHIRRAAGIVVASFQKDVIITWVHEAALGQRSVESIFAGVGEMCGADLPPDMKNRICELVAGMKAELAAQGEADDLPPFTIPIWTTSRPMRA